MSKLPQSNRHIQKQKQGQRTHYSKKGNNTMSKMSDFLKKAADKKKGIHHPEADDTQQVERKTAKQRAPIIGKKPPTRSAGRGR